MFSDPLLGLAHFSARPFSTKSFLTIQHLRLWPDYATSGSLTAHITAVLSVLAAWATGLFGNIPGQDLQQRVFAAKDATTASRACVLAGLLYLVFGSLPLLLGFASLVTHPGGTLDPVAYLAHTSLTGHADCLCRCCGFDDCLNSDQCSAGTRNHSWAQPSCKILPSEWAGFVPDRSVSSWFRLASASQCSVSPQTRCQFSLLRFCARTFWHLRTTTKPDLLRSAVSAFSVVSHTWDRSLETNTPQFFHNTTGYSVRFLWTCCQCLR